MLMPLSDDFDLKATTERMNRQEAKVERVLSRYDELLGHHKTALETIKAQEEQISMLMASLNQKQYSKSVQKRTLTARQQDKEANH